MSVVVPAKEGDSWSRDFLVVWILVVLTNGYLAKIICHGLDEEAMAIVQMKSGVTTMTKKKKLIKNVSDATFEKEVVQREIPVFVDFWAPWCGPCRMVAPVIEELAEEYEGRIKFVKVNTDENPMVASALGIRSIPTLVVFKGNKVEDFRIGAVPKDELKKMLDGVLGEKKGLFQRLLS